MIFLKIIKWILLILIGSVFIMLSVSNSENVKLVVPILDITFLFPLYIIFFSVLIIGIMFGGGVGVFYLMKVKMCFRKSKKRIAALEKEISALRMNKNISDSSVAISDYSGK